MMRALFLGLVCLLSLAGCSSGPPGVSLPVIDADAAARQVMDEYDVNKDGTLDAAELAMCPPLKHSLEAFDANGDKGLTAAEIADRLRTYKDGNAGLFGLPCWVTLDGKPLAGAQVKLIPEKFLPNIKPASGTSDDQGFVRLETEGMEFPGVQYGLFRIEVTTAGGNLPARYNTESQLGTEVSMQSMGRGVGLSIALSSSP